MIDWAKEKCADKSQVLLPTFDRVWFDVKIPGEDVSPSPVEETAAALEEMRRDRTAHLASILLRHLAAGERVEEIAAVAIPHLGICTWCCGILRDTLNLTGVPQGSLAYAVLEDAEEWGRWDMAGRIAAGKACGTLMEQGIGYTYGRDGAVYTRKPDGQEVQLHEAEPSAL